MWTIVFGRDPPFLLFPCGPHGVVRRQCCSTVYCEGSAESFTYRKLTHTHMKADEDRHAKLGDFVHPEKAKREAYLREKTSP